LYLISTTNEKPFFITENFKKIYQLEETTIGDILSKSQDEDLNSYFKTQLNEARLVDELLFSSALPAFINTNAEIWAAGVTYKKSKDARNSESKNKNSYYDKVYSAMRPEIFFKSSGKNVASNLETMYLRNDSKWQVPEPELGLLLSRKGTLLGYTIGNDLSCRDIEGENPLYLPQAKIWSKSCAVSNVFLIHNSSIDPYDFQIDCKIIRNNSTIYSDSTSTKELNRSYEELILYLTSHYELEDGSILLTGTSLVPPESFTLQKKDEIQIKISNIGTLVNTVLPYRKDEIYA